MTRVVQIVPARLRLVFGVASAEFSLHNTDFQNQACHAVWTPRERCIRSIPNHVASIMLRPILHGWKRHMPKAITNVLHHLVSQSTDSHTFIIHEAGIHTKRHLYFYSNPISFSISPVCSTSLIESLLLTARCLRIIQYSNVKAVSGTDTATKIQKCGEIPSV